MKDFFSLLSEAKDSDDFIPFIKKGLDLRPDKASGKTFWDDFMTLISANPDAASDFLGIPRATISTLRPKIKNLVDKVAEQDRSSRGKNHLI